MVSRVLIDQGNSTDILYWRTFLRLEVSPDTVHPYAEVNRRTNIKFWAESPLVQMLWMGHEDETSRGCVCRGWGTAVRSGGVGEGTVKIGVGCGGAATVRSGGEEVRW
ncbi:hypothetical protein JHK85_000930 [Glycine max]|nr:hypothetical protein JHK85_000930 [Glycine max]